MSFYIQLSHIHSPNNSKSVCIVNMYLEKCYVRQKKKKAYKYVQDTATAIQYRRDNKSINVCNVRYTMIRAVRAIKTSCLQSYTAGHTANCYPFGKSLWQHVKRIIRLYKFLTWSS